MSLVLASGSPRRKYLMEMLGAKDLIIIPAKAKEEPPSGASPEETVIALASAKAAEVSAMRPESDIIIAADTIVWCGGKILGKPASAENAYEMLSELSGKTHKVYTGVCVSSGGRSDLRYDVTEVTFRRISPDEIKAYVSTGEPMDKAGAYGAQGLGALFVEKINGDYYNVIGLPVCLLGQMLSERGVSLL